MNTIGDRIKILVDKFSKGNKSEFAKNVNTSEANIRNYISGTQPKYDVLASIISTYIQVSPDWLMNGKGAIYRAQNEGIKHLFENYYEKTKNSKNVVEKNDYKNDYIIEDKPNVPNNLQIDGEEMPIYKAEGEINYGPKGLYRGKSSELVPYYDVDFAAGGDILTFEDGRITPAYYMDVPEFSGCTAFRAYSDSMEKLIKSGSILFGTKIEAWLEHLEYGQIYGIVCTDGRRYLKYIRKAKKHSSHFLLRSENKEYDDFDIPKKAIRNVWLVHGWLNKRT